MRKRSSRDLSLTAKAFTTAVRRGEGAAEGAGGNGDGARVDAEVDGRGCGTGFVNMLVLPGGSFLFFLG